MTTPNQPLSGAMPQTLAEAAINAAATLAQENAKLRQQLTAAREALGFYANDGGKVDVIRDLEKVRRLALENDELRKAMTVLQNSWAETRTRLDALTRDWAEDHTHLQQLCRKAGCSKAEVDGDSHGVPSITDLADLLSARLDEAVSVLWETEWHGFDSSENGSVCPDCFNCYHDGHKSDCRLAKALKGKK